MPAIHFLPERAAALARKYGRLVELRSRRDGAGPMASREELRALAAEFPGSLRELDTLGDAELRRRAAACAAAAAGAATEPWMSWIDRFHHLMRQALAARAKGGPGGSDFERAALSPPEGRMLPLVLAEVAREFGQPADQVRATLFPSRRAKR